MIVKFAKVFAPSRLQLVTPVNATVLKVFPPPLNDGVVAVIFIVDVFTVNVKLVTPEKFNPEDIFIVEAPSVRLRIIVPEVLRNTIPTVTPLVSTAPAVSVIDEAANVS